MSEKLPTEAESDASEALLDKILEAVTLAVQEAVRDHKRAGNHIATWEDGRVVWIAPEDIED